MIRIVQIGKKDDNPGGERLYEVGINNDPAITTFIHRRSDGLAVCLSRASKAVERSDRDRALRILQELQS